MNNKKKKKKINMTKKMYKIKKKRISYIIVFYLCPN